MVCLPLIVSHTVNALTRIINIQIQPLFFRFSSVPFTQAVAAKIRQNHQVDVLNFFMLIKML
ncbi:Uncharacterised protein [Vibrio cholerae]|nr:Uncharacterised protein [Vibrio cholerae]